MSTEGDPPSGTSSTVFEVRHLTVDFASRRGDVRVVEDVSLAVRAGQTLGIVGESGVGKSVTMLAALRLLPEPPARVVSGEALLDGVDLRRLRGEDLRRVRGRDIGIVFQDPLTSLHPSMRIGDQIAEALRLHARDLSRARARDRAVELLELVRVPAARQRARDYPHEWSGGMRQRAMIAMAIANGPKLLVADEPTTALDVTTQAQVLDVLRDVQREVGAAVIVITHDLGVIAELADEVVVLHRGRVVESGRAAQVFTSPRLPYTAGLLARPAALVRAAPTGSPAHAEAVLEVTDLVKHFRNRADRRGPPIPAVDGVTFDLRPGEALGLVGESGCGKSTLARTIVRLLEPTSGRIRFEGHDITDLRAGDLRSIRTRLRIVFQDSHSSLNPRRTVHDIVAEPLRIHRRYRRGGRDRVEELLGAVGLDATIGGRFAHELSGGERQRVGIARALALEPRVLVLDEPVSSLDLPIQAQILGLLERLQRELGLAYILASHDLAVVRRLCRRVLVMYLGRVVEVAEVDSLYRRPDHPYTQALLSAIPISSPVERGSGGRIILTGDPPDPTAPPSGCAFRTRCWLAEERCSVERPALRRLDAQRACACHLV